MTRAGLREFVRRIVVMVILVVALTMIGYGRYLLGGLLLVAALVIYIYLPAIKPPAGALQYDAGKSQVGPDWLGFVLSSLFFAFPIWAPIGEPIGARSTRLPSCCGRWHSSSRASGSSARCMPATGS